MLIRNIVIVLGLSGIIAPLVAQKIVEAKPKKIIFLRYYNESNDKNSKYLENSISESIHELVKDKYKYERVSADATEKFLAVHNYTEADLFDTAKLQQMGLALKTDGIIFGKFTTTPGNIKITGKILSVVDREIIAEKTIESRIDNEMLVKVDDLSESLAARIKDLFYPSDTGALWRSAVLPGWGQHYKQRKTFAYIYGGLTIGAAAWTSVSLILWISANNKYYNYQPAYITTPQGQTSLLDPTAAASEFSALKAKSEQWEKITLISLGITLGIYAWQLFDAWFFDGSYAKPGEAQAKNGGLSNYFGGAMLSGDRDPLSLKLSIAF